MSKTVQYYELNETNDKRIYLEIEEDDDFVTKDMIKKNKIVYQQKLCLGLLPEEVIHKIQTYMINESIESIRPHFEERINYYNENYNLENYEHNHPMYQQRMLERNRDKERRYLIGELCQWGEDDMRVWALWENNCPFSNAGKIDYIKRWKYKSSTHTNDMKDLQERYRMRGIEVLYLNDNTNNLMNNNCWSKSDKQFGIKELKNFCKMNGLKKYSKLKKVDLIKLLMTI